MTASNVARFRPLDDLESSLLETWREVSRVTHRFLVLLREFDLRHGWKPYGNNDCAEWLNWKCGISRVTAQEKVRMARVLWGLEQIDAAFENGDLSYSKVRALCRVATPANETELLAFALTATATQVEGYCRRLRHGDVEVSEKDARRLHEARSMCRQFREDGSGSLTVELPRAELDLVLKALEHVGSTLPEDSTRSLFAKGADALVQMARDTLAGRCTDGLGRESYQVLVHIDASALSGKGGESDLPLPTVRRLTCDGAVVPIIERADGTPLDVGRKQRTIPTALKRAVLARDRTCTFPGCHQDRWLDVHHVRHWADGGETNLDNLLTLCTTHHTLVHEGGFAIQRNRAGQCHFVRPDGRLVDVDARDDHVCEASPVYRICHSAEWRSRATLAATSS